MSESATETLRQMLDERGVEHYDGSERTLWGYEPTGEDTGIYRYAASEISGGFLQFDMFRITPEQAIAATLGGGKLTAEQVREAIYDCSTYANYDGCTYHASGIRLQAIVDELNATLGDGEREKELEKLAWDMWCEITTCPDYRMPPCMTGSICERVRNLEIGVDERR